VDLDRQAVEVAQLSLFLKLLEGERAVSAPPYLPDLSRNVVCGNSLTSLATGKFDAIIGNPPYGAALQPLERKLLAKRFAIGTTDTAALMLSVAFGSVREKFRIGMIVPKPITYSSSWSGLRDRTQHNLRVIVDVGKAWKEVKLEQSICIFGDTTDIGTPHSYLSLRRNGEAFTDEIKIPKKASRTFGFWLNGIEKAALRAGLKIAAGVSLGEIADNSRGAMLQGNMREGGTGKVILGGRHIARYGLHPSSLRLPPGTDIPDNGKIVPGAILAQNIVAHIANPVGHIKIMATLATPKLSRSVLLDTVNQIRSTTPIDNKFLLGIINSRLASWYMYRFVYGFAIRTMHFDATSTDRLPIPKIDLANPQHKSRHDHLVALVTQLLKAKEKEALAAGNALEIIRRKCVTLDRQTDALVYELYGLSEEEIRLVEGG